MPTMHNTHYNLIDTLRSANKDRWNTVCEFVKSKGHHAVFDVVDISQKYYKKYANEENGLTLPIAHTYVEAALWAQQHDYMFGK